MFLFQTLPTDLKLGGTDHWGLPLIEIIKTILAWNVWWKSIIFNV
jgi:hypothetical protein